MTTARTVCGLYTRVSSRNQADAEYSSLETQRERLEAYCKSQEEYSVYRVYEDGGYSADSLDRPALKEMLRDMRDGKLNCVLAYKIDRLTRSVKDFHVLMDLFDRSGVKFVSVTQSLDTQNPMGRLLRNVLLDFAQFEREMTADRTRDKMYQRAQKAFGMAETCLTATRQTTSAWFWMARGRNVSGLCFFFSVRRPRLPGYETSCTEGVGIPGRVNAGARVRCSKFLRTRSIAASYDLTPSGLRAIMRL